MNDSLFLLFSNFSINLLTLAICILLFDCRKEYARVSVVNGVVFQVSVELFDSLGWSQGDLACILVSLILLTAVRIRIEYNPWHSLELSTAFSTNGGQCRRERLHVTVFGKTAILSLERALNCTNILYSDEVGLLRRFLEGLIDHVVAIG